MWDRHFINSSPTTSGCQVAAEVLAVVVGQVGVVFEICTDDFRSIVDGSPGVYHFGTFNERQGDSIPDASELTDRVESLTCF